MAASSSNAPVELPWLEKYRPSDFRDVVGNDETLSRLAVIAEQGNMPNIIITVRPIISLQRISHLMRCTKRDSCINEVQNPLCNRY